MEHAPGKRGTGGPPVFPSTTLRLSIAARTGQAHVPFLARCLRRALGIIKTPLADLSVALVGYRTMSRLNERFMGRCGATDVLSFPLETDFCGRVVSGEIVICLPEAQEQARRRKIPLRHELLLYALHGILHMSGYEDRTQAGYRKMHRAEDRILTKLGIGATFAPSEGRGEVRGKGAPGGAG
jgi:probable rRNA maturation factor